MVCTRTGCSSVFHVSCMLESRLTWSAWGAGFACCKAPPQPLVPPPPTLPTLGASVLGSLPPPRGSMTHSSRRSPPSPYATMRKIQQRPSAEPTMQPMMAARGWQQATVAFTTPEQPGMDTQLPPPPPALPLVSTPSPLLPSVPTAPVLAAIAAPVAAPLAQPVDTPVHAHAPPVVPGRGRGGGQGRGPGQRRGRGAFKTCGTTILLDDIHGHIHCNFPRYHIGPCEEEMGTLPEDD